MELLILQVKLTNNPSFLPTFSDHSQQMNKNYKRKTENMQVIISLNQTDDSSSSRNRLVNHSFNKSINIPLISVMRLLSGQVTIHLAQLKCAVAIALLPMNILCTKRSVVH